MEGPGGLPLPPDLDPRGQRPRRRSQVERLGKMLAVVASALVFVTAVGGYAVVKWFDGTIARIHLNLGRQRPAAAPPGTENWLLAGLDSRAGTGGQYGDVAGARSDTTILAHLDTDGITTNVSIPRDTLVTIPAYTDSQGQAHPSHKDKFNAAISLGGPSLMVRTVELLTGIRIDHYMSVDLAGFKQISQAVGGVPVCILASSHSETTYEAGITHTSTNIDDSYSGFHGHDGVQTVIGDQALAFVRQRHGLVDGDIGRIQRQQQFLGSVFRGTTSSKILFDPVRVARLLSAIKGALTLDQHTSLTDLERLALRLKGADPGKIRFETIPQLSLSASDSSLGQVFSDSGGILELIPNGQTQSVGSVQILEPQPFQAMLSQLKAVASTTVKAPSTPRTTAPLTVPPSQVLVTVENGVGTTGLAGQVSHQLAVEGFRTGPPTTALASTYRTSEIHYPPGLLDAARTLAAAVPGTVLRPDPTVTTGVVLIVGSTYRGVVPISGTAIASPAAPVSPPIATPAPDGALATAASPSNRCTY